MKRIVTLIATITFFILFKSYVPLRIYEKAPILLSILFAIIIVVLLAMTLTNIFNLKTVKKIYASSDKLAGLLITFIIVMIAITIGLTFYFVINEMDRVENDLMYNSKKTHGIILSKNQIEQRRRFKTYTVTKVKVEYIVNGKKIISEHNSNLGLIQLPEIGSKVKIMYSANLPDNFIIDQVENSTKEATIEDTMKLIESMK